MTIARSNKRERGKHDGGVCFQHHIVSYCKSLLSYIGASRHFLEFLGVSTWLLLLESEWHERGFLHDIILLALRAYRRVSPAPPHVQ